MNFAKRIEVERKLREIERQRGHYLASLADLELEDDAASGFSIYSNDRAQRAKAILEKRRLRRAKEMEKFGCYIAPGVWDDDLDNYQESSYSELLPDGYSIRLVRNRGMSWNGYVTVPQGHPAIDMSYFDIPGQPFELTYGSGNTFGFDHQHMHDVLPFRENSMAEGRENPLHFSKYFAYADARKECLQLIECLKKVGSSPAAPDAPDAPDAPEAPAEEKKLNAKERRKLKRVAQFQSY